MSQSRLPIDCRRVSKLFASSMTVLGWMRFFFGRQRSVDDEGMFKQGVEGHYQTMLWVDETSKELIIQIACM